MKKYFLNKMSTGKRLAKRSIIGTRVCAPGVDGIWYSGVIHAVKTPANPRDNNNCINLTPNTKYSVRFDSKQDALKRGPAREFRESELIGPGFRNILDVKLRPGQKVFLTYNGRESSGEVLDHDDKKDEVTVRLVFLGQEVSPFIYYILSYCLLRLRSIYGKIKRNWVIVSSAQAPKNPPIVLSAHPRSKLNYLFVFICENRTQLPRHTLSKLGHLNSY